MIEELLQELNRRGRDKAVWRLHRDAENLLTPLEVMALKGIVSTLPAPTQKWLEGTDPYLKGEPQGYLRTELSEHIDLYSDPAYQRAEKRLVIAFCGHVNRLMMPLHRMLQCLPSQLFDLVLLMDSNRVHFQNGVPPVAGSLLELVDWLTSRPALRGHKATLCYGTSGGAFAALRAGILMKAEQAISVGGRFHSHPARIAHAVPMPAFDPLCLCFGDVSTKLTCVYSAGCEHDRQSTEQLTQTLAVERLVVPGVSHHVPFMELTTEQLEAFFGRVFEFESTFNWVEVESTLKDAELATS